MERMSRPIAVGDTATRTIVVSDEMIRSFATLTGDLNPVHLDDDYALQTRFGGRIAHGLIPLSAVAAILGMDLPGPGTVYLGQTVRFVAPVRPGDTVTAAVEVVSVRADKPIMRLRTTCTNDRGEAILDGEATVLHEPQPRA